MLWMMGDEFYDVVTIKIKSNWKSNWTISLMETQNYRKQQENQQTVLPTYTQIVSK